MHITSEVRYGSLMTRYVLAATVVLAVTLFSAPARAQSYIVSAADGMDVTWTQRGAAPSGTVQIAACDLTVVMAWDGSQFWSSTRYGQSNTWSVFGTAPPTGLTSITCYDNQLVYLDVDDHLWAYAANRMGGKRTLRPIRFLALGARLASSLALVYRTTTCGTSKTQSPVRATGIICLASRHDPSGRSSTRFLAPIVS
jgi:hypothetical protein